MINNNVMETIICNAGLRKVCKVIYLLDKSRCVVQLFVFEVHKIVVLI